MDAVVSSENPSRESPQRAAILAAAVDILGEQGAAALTVRAVASAAGCSTTGVYTWFGGKRGLVEAIFRDGFRRFGAAVDLPADAGDGTPLGRCAAMARAYREWALANPTHYSVMFGRAVPDYEPSDEAKGEALETFVTLVRAMEGLAAAGEIDADPVEAATFAWATMHGYVSIEIAGMSVVETAEEREAAFAAGMRRVLRGCLVSPP